jgi:hypothetical protein
VFLKRVVSRIFGSKEDEVAGAQRKLHNEECHTLNASPNTPTIMKFKQG